MTTFKEIQDRVISLMSLRLDDDLIDIIPALINQGVNEIAGGMLSSLASIVTPPLPELFTLASVDTDITRAFVDMPSNFQRTLQFAVKANGSEVDIAHSLIEFTETNPAMTKAGPISEVVEHGKKFYYLNIPTVSEALTLHYYRMPVDMVEAGDTPDGIPLHLQMSLLSNFAVWKAYEFIEDGIEGETPNTMKFKEFFFVVLKTLELSLPDYTRGLELR